MKKITLLSLMASTWLFGAQEVKKTELVTHTELSYVRTQGNTDTTAFSLDFTGKQQIQNYSIKLDVDALYGDEKGIENKNLLKGELNIDYAFVSNVTINYLAGYKEDKFSGFDYQLYTGPGMKWIAIASKAHKLDIQANILYSQDNQMQKYYTDNTKDTEVEYPYKDGLAGSYLDPDSGAIDIYTGYVAQMNYAWQITQNFKFVQEASYRGDLEDSNKYFAFSKTAIESKISDILSLGISYKIDYTNEPPANNYYSDTTFMTSLIIDY